MKAFVTKSAIALAALTVSVSSGAVIFNDDFAGATGSISTSTPEVGSGSWTVAVSGGMNIDGGNAVRSGVNANGTASIPLASVLATDTVRLDIVVNNRGGIGRVTAALNSGPVAAAGGAATSLAVHVLNSPAGTVRITGTGTTLATPLVEYAASHTNGDTISIVANLGTDTVQVLRNNIALAAPVALGFDLTPAAVSTLILDMTNGTAGANPSTHAVGEITVSATPIPEPASALAIGAMDLVGLRRRR